ncbi:MAG: multidrug effflux MFS transporter [Pseudomonadota bacterium]
MTHSRHLSSDSPALLPLLAALVALGPLSIDMYLPAMPLIKEDLNTDIARVQLTMSSYLTGFALFHLVCGPLSDRFGRRPILLSGTLLFVLASLGCAQSDSIDELLMYRFVQGIGACVGPTLARAMVRDLFGPSRAARALSVIAMLMALAPAIAPLIGGLALLIFPWPSIFVFLAGYGLIMIFLIYINLAESLPSPQSLHPGKIARNFIMLAGDRDYMTAVLICCLLYSGMMSYLAASSFVFIDMYGVPRELFGLIFLTLVLGYIAGSGLSARLSRRYLPETTIVLGVALSVAAGAACSLAAWIFPKSVLALAMPMGFYITGLGLVMPNSMAVALRPYPQIAGTASALLGFLQMALSALATASVGALLTSSALPVILSISLAAMVALPLSLYLFRQRPQPPGN